MKSSNENRVCELYPSDPSTVHPTDSIKRQASPSLINPPKENRRFCSVAEMMDDSSDLCSATPSLNSSKEPKRPLDSPSESLKPPKQQRSEEEAGEGGDGMSHNSKAQRYLIAVEYIGTRFSGSQRQPNCRTVVGLLEVMLVACNTSFDATPFEAKVVAQLLDENMFSLQCYAFIVF